MYSNEINKAVARLLVCGISIDSELTKKDREVLSSNLNSLGADYLLPEVSEALDQNLGDIDLFKEAKIISDAELKNSELENIFSLICNIISSDRFVSLNEANFLSGTSRRLRISQKNAKSILQKALSSRNGRLEISGKQIDPLIHPYLKELLSFEGAENIIGEVPENSIQNLIENNKFNYSEEELNSALNKLGLTSFSRPEDAALALNEIIKSTDLLKLSDQGIDYLESGIKKIMDAVNSLKIIRSFSSKT